MRPITSFRHSVARCVKNFLTHQRGIGTVAKKSSIGASQRGWHSNLTKIHWFIVFHILIWGGWAWSFVWGISLPKPPCD